MSIYSFETLIKTDGYPKLATIFVTCGALLNCVLDYLLVIVLQCGVKGAAFATGISQASVIILYLTHFLGKNATIRFTRFKFRPGIIARQIRNGLSSGITAFSIVSTGICYSTANWIVSLFLKDMTSELAVYSVRVFRIFILSFLLAGFNIIIGGYFTSIEKAGLATAISLTRSIIALVGALLLLTALFGGEGIWWAPLMAEAVCLILSVTMFTMYWKKEIKMQ